MNSAKRSLFLSLMAGILCLYAVPAFAAGGHYQIELIVFESLLGDDRSEAWYEGANAVSGSDIPYTVDQLPGSGDVPADDLTLQNVYASLRSSRNYRPLLYRAWHQPGLSRSAAKAISILVPGADGGHPLLEGTARLARGRFLHLELDLAYLPEEARAAQGGVFGEPRYLRLHQERRMRRDELHYIDHPRFGVLVYARRYNPANAASPDPAATQE